jgi:hypothetical protein
MVGIGFGESVRSEVINYLLPNIHYDGNNEKGNK